VRSVDSPQLKTTVNAYEIYQEIDHTLVADMCQWIRENDKTSTTLPSGVSRRIAS